jgi:hypothetical protein
MITHCVRIEMVDAMGCKLAERLQEGNLDLNVAAILELRQRERFKDMWYLGTVRNRKYSMKRSPEASVGIKLSTLT